MIVFRLISAGFMLWFTIILFPNLNLMFPFLTCLLVDILTHTMIKHIKNKISHVDYNEKEYSSYERILIFYGGKTALDIINETK